MLYDVEYARTVDREIASGKYEVVIAEYPWMGQYIHHANNIKKILVEHNVEYAFWYQVMKTTKFSRAKVHYLLEWLTLLRYEKRICRRFDICVVMSEIDRDKLLSLDPHLEVVVIPNGVDTGYFEFKPDGRPSTNLIYIGAMNNLTNIDAVLYFNREIYPRIKKEIPDVQFTIIGGNPTPQVLTLMNDASISVTGYVDDVRPFADKGTIFVVPLRIGSGTRLKILEALAMGIPIVTTSLGIEGIQARNGEHLLIADTPQEFARCVIELLQDKQFRLRLAAEGRKLVERKYDWRVIGNQMDKLIQHLTSS